MVGRTTTAYVAVRCNNPLHESCAKSRSLHLRRDALGPRAAEAFLSVWLLASDIEEPLHKKHMPTVEEMRAFLAEDA